MAGYTYSSIPRSRIATFDVYAVAMYKHHISALLEFDVTESRKKIRDMRKKGIQISFNAWLIKVIAQTINEYKEASSFLYSKKKLIVFDDCNVSTMVEKQLGSSKVPIPVVIEKANTKSALEISQEIEQAKQQNLTEQDIVLNKPSTIYERLYYFFPGIIRRAIWRHLLRHPKLIFGKMGNIMVTTLGATGSMNGWFIHKSVHPVSFGIGAITKKPLVIRDEIKIRDVLNVTVLLDHDVIDGGPMVRLIGTLKKYIETGQDL